VFFVRGLAEHFVSEHDFGVGTQYHRSGNAGKFQQAGPGLFAGDAAYIVLGWLVRSAHLGHIDINGVEANAHHLQQLAAARRLRGEIQHAFPGAVR